MNYTGTKLSSQFENVKDPSHSGEQHDIVYHSFCSSENCNENPISESARRLDEKMKDHNGGDRNSHLFKHAVKSGYGPALKNTRNFRILEKGYRNNTRRKK